MFLKNIRINQLVKIEHKNIMELLETTYRTLIGTKKRIELPSRKSTQYVIYQDDKPKFYVDLYDLSIESNVMMNSLVLCAKKSMQEVLEIINQRNNIHLSLPIITKLGWSKKLKSETKNIDLQPLPEKWLAYSL
ncbi:hypothetical protein [uncultured Polaribacter sp.]|uniref:hypothetical protein n=1 Tax=uncultured Polaribacter sp. TaxID=174711 RepID=UPI0030DBD790|tara:strand:+ start:4651 stop:5052 length:402 start_codon:yes stop_codon:yes gene_type:complete